MADSSSILGPGSGDISVSMLSQLFGSNWWDIINGTSGATGITGVLGNMFSAFNVALLVFVMALLVWQTSMGAMQTAHEGVALGRRYHTIWAPVRAPLAIFFLTPLPLIKGLTILQALALGSVYLSIGVADTVWGGFTDYMGQHPQSVATSLQSPALTNAVPDQMLYTAVIKKVAENANVASSTWGYNYDGDGYSINVHIGVVTGGNSINSSFGQMNFVCGNPAPTISWSNVGQKITKWASTVDGVITGGLYDPVQSSNDAIFGSTQCKARFNAAVNMLDALDVIAGNLVDSQQGKGSAPTVLAMADAQANYHKAMGSLLGDPKVLQAQMDKQLTGFASSAKDMGWVSTAFYYPAVISVINTQQRAMESVMPTLDSPSYDMDALAKNTGIAKGDLTPAYRAYIAYLNTTSARTSASITGGSGSDGFLGNILKGVANDLQNGNLISVMGYYGSNAITAGTALAALVAAGAVLGAGIGALAGTAVGGPLGTAMGAFLGGAAAAVLGKLGVIGSAIAGVLITEGAVMAYVIPFVPSIIILFAIIGWMVLVMEMFVALPLFAAAFAFAEGEGLAPQQTRHGTTVIGGILLRPTLIVFGFVFSFLLMNVGGNLIGMVFGVVFDTVANDGGIGIIAFVALLGVLVVTVTSLVYFIARLITHLAEHVPMWIGGNAGANLGVDSAAQSAMQQGGGKGTGGAAAGVGYGVQAASGAAKGGSDAVKENRAARAKAATRGQGGGEGGVTTNQSAPVNTNIEGQKRQGGGNSGRGADGL